MNSLSQPSSTISFARRLLSPQLLLHYRFLPNSLASLQGQKSLLIGYFFRSFLSTLCLHPQHRGAVVLSQGNVVPACDGHVKISEDSKVTDDSFSLLPNNRNLQQRKGEHTYSCLTLLHLQPLPGCYHLGRARAGQQEGPGIEERQRK